MNRIIIPIALFAIIVREGKAVKIDTHYSGDLPNGTNPNDTTGRQAGHGFVRFEGQQGGENPLQENTISFENGVQREKNHPLKFEDQISPSNPAISNNIYNQNFSGPKKRRRRRRKYRRFNLVPQANPDSIPTLSPYLLHPTAPPPPLLPVTNAMGMASEMITSLVLNDDKRCLQRLLCERIAEGTGASFKNSSLFRAISGILKVLPDLDKYYDFNSSPLRIATVSVMTAIMYGSKFKNETVCRMNYKTCPTDPRELIHYLNNHKGGLFRFFGGTDSPQLTPQQFHEHLVRLGLSNSNGDQAGVQQPMAGQYGVYQPNGGQAGLQQPAGGQYGVYQPYAEQYGVHQPNGGQAGLRQPVAGQYGVYQPNGGQAGFQQTLAGQYGVSQPYAEQYGVHQPNGGQAGLQPLAEQSGLVQFQYEQNLLAGNGFSRPNFDYKSNLKVNTTGQRNKNTTHRYGYRRTYFESTRTRINDIENGETKTNVKRRIQNKPGVFVENFPEQESGSGWIFPKDQSLVEDYNYINKVRSERHLKFPEDVAESQDGQEHSKKSAKGFLFPGKQSDRPYAPVFIYTHNAVLDEMKNAEYSNIDNELPPTFDEEGVDIVYVVRGNGDPSRPEVFRLRPGEKIH